MSQDNAERQFVTEVLTPYVHHLEPRPGLYNAVLRRHRRRRAGLVAAGVVGVVAAGSVPVAIARHQPGGDGGPAGSPAGEHVRGSLRGDHALIDQARELCAGRPSYDAPAAVGTEQPAVTQPPGSRPSNVRVQVAERLGQDTVVMAYGTTAGGGVVECVVGRTGSGALRWLGGSSIGIVDPASDGRLGQRFYGADPIRIGQVDGLSRRLLLVVAPPDAKAVLRNGFTVTAQPRLVPDNQPVRLHDGGVALVEADGAGQGVTISRAGKTISDSAAEDSPDSRILPSRSELAAMVTGGRGTVNADLVEYSNMDLNLIRLGQVRRQYSCLWGGKLPRGNDDVVVCAATFPSGAAYVWELTSNHYYAMENLLGLLPAGALQHRVLSFKQTVDAGRSGTPALVVVGPPNAARAEATLSNGDVVPVPLHEGGGAIDWPGSVTQVSVYDAANHLIDRRPVGDGLVRPGI
jgi:hypothetical protein